MQERLTWTVAALLLVVLLLVGNIPLIFGTVAPQWDASAFFGPQFTLVADSIKAHHLLFWNPWSAAGTPEFAEPELGTTSPLLLLVGYLSPTPQGGYVTYWLIVWILGGMGMLLLARHLRAPAWGGAVVAIGFVTCGVYTGHAEHMSSLYSISFIPWIVWRFDAAFERRTLWCAFEAGVLFGLSALGGYPQFTILTALFLMLWGAGRVLFPVPDRTRGGLFRKGMIAFSLTMLLGGIVCSPSYLGFLRSTRGYSDRNGPRVREEAVSSNLLETGALATAASPYLAVLNMPPQIWPKSDVSMTSIYLGAGVVVFALLALSARERWRWWLLGIYVLFLLCALGDQLPVRGLLYDLVPPTRYFRNPSLFRLYFLFVTAVLGCYGARDLENSESPRKRTTLFVLCLLAAYAAIPAFEAVVHSTPKQLPWSSFGLLHLLTVWLGCIYLAWRFRWRNLSKQRLATLFVALACFDGFSALWLSKTTLYSKEEVGFWRKMNEGHVLNLNLGAQGLNRTYLPPEQLGTYPNNRNLVSKVPILQSYTTLKNRYFDALLADPDLRAIASGPNRFWFSAHPVWLPPDDAAFNKFAASVKIFQRPTLVLHSPESMTQINRRITGSGADVTISSAAACIPAALSAVTYLPNLFAFDYVAPEPGWLLVTDRWALGWQVRINGKDKPVTGGDFLFRAVPVEAGINHVSFTYKPEGFFITLLLSWSILGLAVVLEGVRLSRSFRSGLPLSSRSSQP